MAANGPANRTICCFSLGAWQMTYTFARHPGCAIFHLSYEPKEGRSRSNGKDSQLVQAARPCFSIERNLRWIKRLLGLRPARGRAKKKSQGFLVAPDGQGKRRYRWPGWIDPNESTGVGRQRP